MRASDLAPYQASRGRSERVALFHCSTALLHFPLRTPNQNEGDAHCEKALVRIEAPPERERPQPRAGITRVQLALALACAFSEAGTEHRAPKTLHVGRRPPQSAQRAVADPGLKGRREA